ncbi:hypothetical protein F5Y12DRAFT_227491 [Xylaria sp. FL1777]|nr:hypothetical protein F5Y12DRAFT_227491 [Xylaria sp. FL1777]
MSAGWKDVVKNGWHPEKTGSSLKSQVKGLVGRGDTSESSREAHVATPRSSLRDPSSFGPPPKRVAAYGAPQTQATPASSSSGSQPYSAVQPSQTQHVKEQEPPAEPKPYRADTTGLSTSHLPPPPTRTDGGPATTPQPGVTVKPKAPPSLPPRLPPRSGNSSPNPTSAGGQAASEGYLNQGAVNRLGAAGILVPGFGIGVGGGGGGGGGGRTPPPLPPSGARPSPPSTVSPMQAQGHGQTDELQARFARMGTSPSSQASATVPSVLGKKKPPPPPKAKKPGLSGAREGADTPPPIPLATRPRFD